MAQDPPESLDVRLPRGAVPPILQCYAPSGIRMRGKKRPAPVTSTVKSPRLSPPRKKAQTRQSSSSTPTEFRTVAECYTMKFSKTDAQRLQCYLIHVPERMQIVEIQNRPNSPTGRNSVLNIIVADRTGPLQVDLWQTIGEQFLEDFSTAVEQSDQPLLVDISNFWIRGESRVQCLTPMVRAVSSTRTTIQQIEQSTQSSIKDESTAMSSSLYVRTFACLARSPPFKVSIAGIVQKAEGVVRSQKNTLIQRFRLHDATGRHVTCIAFGRHAGSAAIENGNDVIVYFASGVANRSAKNPGALWLYDDAHVVTLQTRCEPPAATVHIDLK